MLWAMHKEGPQRSIVISYECWQRNNGASGCSCWPNADARSSIRARTIDANDSLQVGVRSVGTSTSSSDCASPLTRHIRWSQVTVVTVSNSRRAVLLARYSAAAAGGE